MRYLQLLNITTSLLLLTSCNGIFSDIYDPAPDDNAFTQGFTTRLDSPGRYQLKLDARSYRQWHFIDLKDLTITSIDIPTELTGEWDGKSGWTYNLVEGDRYTELSSYPKDTQPEPDSWDFAIHHFDVRTNGGAVLATDYEGLLSLPGSSSSFPEDGYQPDVWSTTQVITDLTGMMGFRIGYQNSYVNKLLSQWATMDFSTPPPVYSSTGKVYLLRMSDGTVAALLLSSYMSTGGTKGFLTIDIKYPY